MQSSTRNTVIAVALCVAIFIGWKYVQDMIWPPPPKPQPAPLTEVQANALLLGGAALAAADPAPAVFAVGGPAVSLAQRLPPDPPPTRAEAVALVGGAAFIGHLHVPKPRPASERPELVALGHGDNPYALRVLLTTQGGAVQRVVLSHFEQADREGLRVLGPDGKPKPLPLVPGVRVAQADTIRGQRDIPVPDIESVVADGGRGRVPEDKLFALDHPSFALFHYEQPGDDRPLDTLGREMWTVKSVENDPAADEQRVVFEKSLGDPFFVTVTKTFALKRRDYHVGLTVDVKRQEKKRGLPFRYQIVGARGLPIEGEWYTSVYREAIVGTIDKSGTARRTIEAPQEIRMTEGGERHASSPDRPIRLAGTKIQYFAAMLAVSDVQAEGVKPDFIQYARTTPEGLPFDTHGVPVKEKPFLDDMTVRVIAAPVDADKSATHQYVLYNGPAKVRLLRQLKGEKAVPDDVVDRYLDKLHLDVMTDAPMPNFFGRVANTLFWSDLVVGFTNIIHSLLGFLHGIVGDLGVSIILITVLVRGLLYPLSRRQQYNSKMMQDKMAKMAPELKALQEKYGSDFQRMNQEKMLLYRKHGVNPFSAMGGCLLVILQMPVFMGLYYALQENVLFRSDGFLWMPNLAAPDMLVFWTEKIPWISTPDNLGSMIYLGPYLNVLPLIAVALMMVQQNKMMPTSADPQVQAQMKMMKYMMIFFGVMFYKVPAGLCIYFILSTTWGLAERKFMPKPKPPAPDDGDDPDEEPAELGWWGKKKQGWRDKWKRLLEEAQKNQELRRDGRPPEPPAQRGGAGGGTRETGGGGKKKKHKK